MTAKIYRIHCVGAADQYAGSDRIGRELAISQRSLPPWAAEDEIAAKGLATVREILSAASGAAARNLAAAYARWNESGAAADFEEVQRAQHALRGANRALRLLQTGKGLES